MYASSCKRSIILAPIRRQHSTKYHSAQSAKMPPVHVRSNDRCVRRPVYGSCHSGLRSTSGNYSDISRQPLDVVLRDHVRSTWRRSGQPHQSPCHIDVLSYPAYPFARPPHRSQAKLRRRRALRRPGNRLRRRPSTGLLSGGTGANRSSVPDVCAMNCRLLRVSTTPDETHEHTDVLRTQTNSTSSQSKDVGALLSWISLQ